MTASSGEHPRAPGSDVCVVGGGPAGMMLAVLLLRAGLSVTVLEKHADFLRDFRGDTVHASTIRLMDELGWADEFLRLPHQKIHRLSGVFGGETYTVADCSRLPGRHRYIALMPQWDFLDFLADKAAQYPGFTLLRSTKVDGLLRDGAEGRVAGVALVLIDRSDYFQIAYIIPKGGFDKVKAAGLAALVEKVGQLAPSLAGRTAVTTRDGSPPRSSSAPSAAA